MLFRSADLAEMLGTLLSNPHLRARMGAAGRRKVEQRFDWARIGAELERMYAMALALPPRHQPSTRGAARS